MKRNKLLQAYMDLQIQIGDLNRLIEHLEDRTNILFEYIKAKESNKIAYIDEYGYNGTSILVWFDDATISRKEILLKEKASEYSFEIYFNKTKNNIIVKKQDRISKIVLEENDPNIEYYQLDRKHNELCKIVFNSRVILGKRIY